MDGTEEEDEQLARSLPRTLMAKPIKLYSVIYSIRTYIYIYTHKYRYITHRERESARAREGVNPSGKSLAPLFRLFGASTSAHDSGLRGSVQGLSSMLSGPAVVESAGH